MSTLVLNQGKFCDFDDTCHEGSALNFKLFKVGIVDVSFVGD